MQFLQKKPEHFTCNTMKSCEELDLNMNIAGKAETFGFPMETRSSTPIPIPTKNRLQQQSVPTYGQPLYQRESQFIGHKANSGANLLPFPLNMTAASLQLLQNHAQNQLLLQQQEILRRKQELAAAAAAKQQWILSSATAANKNGHDEISSSLKMYAALSACEKNVEPSHSPVEEVMQEFNANGYTTDDFNKYQQYQAALPKQFVGGPNVFPMQNNLQAYDQNLKPHYGVNNSNALYNQQGALHDNFYREIYQQSLLQLLSPNFLRQAEIAAAAIDMDYNLKKKKFFKRKFNKNEPQIASKRCVFCENNNEPEAVVKSHAVRDSHGRVLCPKLRVYICPICHASGDDAHTVKYCPQKTIITMEQTLKGDMGRISKKDGYIKPNFNH